MTGTPPRVDLPAPRLIVAWRSVLPTLAAGLLLVLGASNIVTRATWREAEDGVLWMQAQDGVVAKAVAAESAAARSGMQPGDLLLAIDGRAVQRVSEVIEAQRAGKVGTTLRYSVLRLEARTVVDIQLAPVPSGPAALYFFLAAVGVFTLLIGTSVRLRRPGDPATLHFFWLSVAFFGVFTFSFSGRLDRLDWVFYWADHVSMLALPPLFLHFSLAFPARTHRFPRIVTLVVWTVYIPAIVLGLARIALLTRLVEVPDTFARVAGAIDRLQYLYLAVCLIGGLVVLMRALRSVRSITAVRQLRWIAWGTALGGSPFALLYALPFAAGFEPTLGMQLSVIPLGVMPLAYACAIVRYRLMDVEIIVKRILVSIAALSAIVGIYLVLLQVVDRLYLQGDAQHNWIIALLATLVAVLLAQPVKDAVQTALDRAFYRDRYDYRRALGAFTRDLNSDLDLDRLSDRLVSRIAETLAVDRMALMLMNASASMFEPVRHVGFGATSCPGLGSATDIGRRLRNGSTLALDEPMEVGRLAAEEIEFWRDAGVFYFVPCQSHERTSAVLALGRQRSGEPLTSEDMELVGAVASQIATALENARLYQQLRLKATELDRLREFDENIVESLDTGLMVLDLDDRVVRWNAALERIYGVTRDEAIGRVFGGAFEASFAEAVQAARRDTPAGVTLSRVPLSAQGSSGPAKRLVNVTIVPLRSGDVTDQAPLGTILIVDDITGRVQLEEQLQISEKMASIGVLAAGVAHEVNTPLTGISSFTQMLLEGAAPEDPRTRLLEKIERQTFRAAKIVNSLLNLSRHAPGAPERAPVDLNAVITDVLSLLEHQLEVGKIKVRRELADRPLVVIGAEHKLQQVFLNLFLNARDAMPKGGWLSIASRDERGHVVVEVADTGSGIPPEHLARIYDPFFTTKNIGQGTGLGLSITYGIVREHGGSLLCESAVGQGTRFVVGFPQPAVEVGPSARVAQ